MVAPPPAAEDRDLGKLRWRCRRGMKELDVLLERYVAERFRGASKPEQDAFLRLLETEDTALYGYCLGQQLPPAEFVALIARITGSTDR